MVRRIMRMLSTRAEENAIDPFRGVVRVRIVPNFLQRRVFYLPHQPMLIM